jgi:hypothetical protein
MYKALEKEDRPKTGLKKALYEVTELMDGSMIKAKEDGKDIKYFEVPEWHWNQFMKNKDFRKEAGKKDVSNIGGFEVRKGKKLKTYFGDETHYILEVE